MIIGSGVAGIAAIEAIRLEKPSIQHRNSDRAEITLIGDDPHGFYSRPGLAYYLTGELHDQALFPRTAADFRALDFRHVRGRVRRIAPAQRLLALEDQATIPYDRLLIAVGAQAVALGIPGAELEGVLKLDHMDDANRILKNARRGRTAVVLGGGITALELVEGLVSRRMKVHYLLRGDRYWSNVLDEQESRIVEHRLGEEGVVLHYHSEALELTGRKGRVSGVRLQDGQEIKCDLVVYAIGVRPRTQLAEEAGLEVDRGIVVNEYMTTSDPDVFAAGDVAQVYDPLSGRAILDSLWNPARQQGHTAGLNMAGREAAYRKPPAFNVTRLAGLTTTIIGMVGRGRDSDLVGIARGDSETWRQLPDSISAQTGFEVNRLRLVIGETTLLGAIVMGDQRLSFPLEKIISERVDISSIREQLLAPNAKIADIIADFWARMKGRVLERPPPKVPGEAR